MKNEGVFALKIGVEGCGFPWNTIANITLPLQVAMEFYDLHAKKQGKSVNPTIS